MKWPTVIINDLCLPTESYDPRQTPDVPFRYVDISSIDRERKVITQAPVIVGAEAPSRARKRIKAGDILVSTVRPNLNAVAIVPDELDGQIASTGFCVLRAHNEVVDNKYLFYYTVTNDFIGTLCSQVRGAHYPAVSDNDVKQVKIPLPPLSEQRRIVEMLDQADAIRKKRAEADTKANCIIPALFFKMFGDPLTNPKKWEVLHIGHPDVAIVNPRVATDSLRDDALVSFVPMADVDEVWGRIVGKQKRPLHEVRKGFTPFQNGDVIFAKITPCMQNGKSAIATELMNGIGFGSTEFHVLRNSKKTTPEWLYALVRLSVFRNQAMASFSGSVGQQRVPSDFITSYKVPIPPIELQNKFSKAINDLNIFINETEIIQSKIETLYNNFLHRAFSGVLTTKWREARMKELLAEMEEQAKVLESRKEDGCVDINGKRHAGHDMFGKAALSAYIVHKCHNPRYPLGRVKLAKLFYLVQRKAELELTQSFTKRAAGPLDDAIFKFLNLAKKKQWVSLGKKQGDLQPVSPGPDIQVAVDSTSKILGEAQATVDAIIEKMKTWGWETLERWATVLNATEELIAAGSEASLQNIKDVLQQHPIWKDKLKREEFSDINLASTLKGLRSFGFIQNNSKDR